MLMKKRKTEQEEPIYYVCIEDTYDIINAAESTLKQAKVVIMSWKGGST